MRLKDSITIFQLRDDYDSEEFNAFITGEQEELSECCDAPIIHDNICSKCYETIKP